MNLALALLVPTLTAAAGYTVGRSHGRSIERKRRHLRRRGYIALTRTCVTHHPEQEARWQ